MKELIFAEVDPFQNSEYTEDLYRWDYEIYKNYHNLASDYRQATYKISEDAPEIAKVIEIMLKDVTGSILLWRNTQYQTCRRDGYFNAIPYAGKNAVKRVLERDYDNYSDEYISKNPLKKGTAKEKYWAENVFMANLMNIKDAKEPIKK